MICLMGESQELTTNVLIQMRIRNLARALLEISKRKLEN